MRYPHIVALIDAYLDRLRSARQLLLSSASTDADQDAPPLALQVMRPNTAQDPLPISSLPPQSAQQEPATPRRHQAGVTTSRERSTISKPAPALKEAAAKLAVAEPAFLRQQHRRHQQIPEQTRPRSVQPTSPGAEEQTAPADAEPNSQMAGNPTAPTAPTLPTAHQNPSLREIVPPAKARSQRKRNTLSRPALTAPANALGAVVPGRPVFIPAAQIRQEQAHRDLPVEDSPATSPLTAELLMQRWLQSPVIS